MRHVNLSLLHNIENLSTELNETTFEFVIISFIYLNFLQDAQEEDGLDSRRTVKHPNLGEMSDGNSLEQALPALSSSNLVKASYNKLGIR